MYTINIHKSIILLHNNKHGHNANDNDMHHVRVCFFIYNIRFHTDYYFGFLLLLFHLLLLKNVISFYLCITLYYLVLKIVRGELPASTSEIRYREFAIITVVPWRIGSFINSNFVLAPPAPERLAPKQ